MCSRILLAAGAIALASTCQLLAEPFASPPESDAMVPPGGWNSPFPYPRNVLIDFKTDPKTWPPDDDGGPQGSIDLIPDELPGGNYHLEGLLDPKLHESDWADRFGSYVWIDEDPRFPGRQGIVGLDNLQSEEEVVATLHLDNERIPRPAKHMWIEMEYYRVGSGGWMASVFPFPTDFEWREEVLADGWVRRTWWVQLEPNPEWEVVQIEAFTGATVGTALLDYVHIATECVPEPSALALLATGVLALAACAWRKGRRR